jgi:hypothetical protein
MSHFLRCRRAAVDRERAASGRLLSTMSGKVTARRRWRIQQRVPFVGTWLAESIRVLRADCDLTRDEQQFLADVLRGRYGQTDVIARFVSMHARCRTERGRFAIVDFLTIELDRRRGQYSLPLSTAVLASDRTLHSWSEGVRQVTMLPNPSPTIIRSAIEAAHAHVRAVIDLARSLSARLAS